MSNRRRMKPEPTIPTAEQTVDAMARSFAQHMFEQKMREHQAEMKREAERQAARLTDNDYAASLSLPTNLPEFTRDILGVTMALDRLGESRPRRDVIYRRYGVS